jgi:type I restriction enzyme S subunit
MQKVQKYWQALRHCYDKQPTFTVHGEPVEPHHPSTSSGRAEYGWGIAMKIGWQVKTLGEICDIVNGSTPLRSKKEFWENGTIEWFTIEDIREQGRKIKRTKQKVTETALKETSLRILPPTSVLLCCTASIGEHAIAEIPLATNQQFNGLVVKDKTSLNPFFLFHFCGTLKDVLSNLSGKTTIDFIPISRLKKVAIPLPPIQEQQRIVAILDQAFEGIAKARVNAEQNLQNARALFESHLQSVFNQRGEGWGEKPLSDLCYIKHGFAFKSEFFTSEGNYVLLTPGNFHETGGYRDRGEKQKYYIGDIPRDFMLNKGDLLVAMTEQAAGLLGSPILVPESDKFLHNQRLGLVTKKSDVPWINEFFFHVFNTKSVRKEIHDSASGVKVRHTSPTKIGEVAVSYPTSISEQHTIVSTLKDLSKETQRLEALYQRKIACLDELKKSLLQQAFAGEL